MTQIGRYEIVRRTGQTPLGTIYEAVDSKTRLTVAIQATAGRPESLLPSGTEARTALEESSESLGRLNHPHIRNLLAVEHADGRLFLVMEHLDAKPVAGYIAAQQTSPVEVVKMLKAAATALDYAHERNVFHPGLTPAHLLIDSGGVLKIAGFEMPGLDALRLKAAGGAERVEVERSAPYRAPEFLCGGERDGRADQFALAAISYELLTRQRLFQYPSPIETMAAILLNPTPDLSLVEAATNATTRRVIEKGLAHHPAQRHHSCTRMIGEMEASLVRKAPSAATRITDSLHEKASAPQPSLIRVKTPPQLNIPETIIRDKRVANRRIVWMVAATVVVMIVVVGLTLALKSRNQLQAQQKAAAEASEQEKIKSLAEQAMPDKTSVPQTLAPAPAPAAGETAPRPNIHTEKAGSQPRAKKASRPKATEPVFLPPNVQ